MPPHPNAAYDTVHVRLTSRILHFLAALTTLAALYAAGVYGASLNLAVACAFAGLAVACLVLFRVGHHEAAAAAVILGSLPCLAISTFLFGGMNGPIPPFCTPLVMLGIALLRPRLAAGVFAVALGLLVGMPLLTPQASIGSSATTVLVTRALAIIEVVIIGGFAFDSLREARTDARARTAESMDSAAAARRALDGKAHFLATMSHELRTPLNAILGYAGLLRDETPEDPDLERIERAGRNLLVLVEDVLELARAESIDIVPEPVDAVAVVREELELLGGSRRVHGAAPVLYNDRRAFRRIVRTVLREVGAALGDVEVRTAGDGVALLVVDTRPASIAATAPSIERWSAPDRVSVGLGLPLCERLARQLGGTFEATSNARGGTTYTLWVPLAWSRGREAS